METSSVEYLNKNFSFNNDNQRVSFTVGEGGIPIVNIQNEQASCSISLQGAHLLSWVPAGQDEVIWVSEDAIFAAQKPIRGGIPICWPWFGAHDSNSSYPAHGFARTALWQVVNTEQLSAGETQITFRLDSSQLNKDIQIMWPTQTIVEYTVTIAKILTIELTTINNSNQTITVGEALHSYFNVEDINNTKVYGLEGKEYLDKPDNFKRKTQTGPIAINTEVDRVYIQTPNDIIIENTHRKIIIKKQGSQSTIVWNPWKSVAEKMGDLGNDGYLKMLCVESANAAQDTIRIKAGETHKLSVMYALEDS